MEKKNVVFLTVLAVATLLTAVVGTTFAYFTATVTNTTTPTATTVTTASDLGITYSDGSAVSLPNAVPGQYTAEKTITVTNNSTSTAMHYQITWDEVSNNFSKGATDTTDDLVYSLTNGSSNLIGTTGYAAAATTNAYVSTTLGAMSGTKAYSVAGGKATIDAGTSEITVAAVPANGVDAILVPDTEIAAGATHTYVLRIYFLETGVSQNENQSSATKTVSFSGKLKASIVASDGVRTE